MRQMHLLETLARILRFFDGPQHSLLLPTSTPVSSTYNNEQSCLRGGCACPSDFMIDNQTTRQTTQRDGQPNTLIIHGLPLPTSLLPAKFSFSFSFGSELPANLLIRIVRIQRFKELAETSISRTPQLDYCAWAGPTTGWLWRGGARVIGGCIEILFGPEVDISPLLSEGVELTCYASLRNKRGPRCPLHPLPSTLSSGTHARARTRARKLTQSSTTTTTNTPPSNGQHRHLLPRSLKLLGRRY